MSISKSNVLFVSEKNKQIVFTSIIILLCMVMVVVFDAIQQKYYVDRFQLWPAGEPISLGLFLKGHSIKWFIWLLAGIPLAYFLMRERKFERPTYLLILKYFVLVLFTVVLASCLITGQIFLTDSEVQSRELFQDNLIFILHQKASVFFIGYVGLLALTYKFREREQLIIEIQELRELNSSNSILYNELKKSHEDFEKIISVKIGNRMKQVPVSEIEWIESDNYCVKLHTLNNSFTIRASMKYLEKYLPPEQFMRVHRQIIVNVLAIEELSANGIATLKLRNGLEVKVANSRLSDVKKRIRSLVA